MSDALLTYGAPVLLLVGVLLARRSALGRGDRAVAARKETIAEQKATLAAVNEYRSASKGLKS
jgi:hypothetical protein